jgi:hypothetical protein
MTRRLLLVAAVAAACSSSYTTPGPAGPTPLSPKRGGPTSQPNAILLAPGTMQYLVHQKVHIQQEFTGLPPTIDLGYGIYLTAAIGSASDSAGYPTSFTIDSVTVDSGSQLPQQIDLTAAQGLTITGRLTPTGEFTNPVPSDSGTAASLSNLLPRFRNFFPRLPEKGVIPDTAWMDTTSATEHSGAATVTTTAYNRRAATTWEDHDGVHALRLELNATFEFNASGEQGGSPFTIAGTGTATGIQYLAGDGRYLGGESSDSTSSTIDLPALGYTIPRRQLAHTTVTALPK